MNRQMESHFSKIPTINMPRSKFDRSHEHVTTFNAGQVVPVFVEDVLPGDSFSVDTSLVCRLQTPIAPFFGNIVLDKMFFFVPYRLVWKNWKYFMGEAKDSPWLDETTYTPPTVAAPSSTGWLHGTIADYMGAPVGVPKKEVNALYFRAYAKIIDDWFRDENLQTPVSIDDGDTDITGNNGTNYITDLVKGGYPFVAARFHDLFSSCQPEPQKGPDVSIGQSFSEIPVVGNGKALGLTNGSQLYGALAATGAASTNNHILNYEQSAYGKDLADSSAYPQSWSSQGPYALGVPTADLLGDDLEKSGLIGLNGAQGFSINDLRMAFAMQKFYEKLALSGSRYIEIIKSMFGVSSSDARLQRSEYLGGNRVPIQVNQVVQTSATQAESGLTTTPQGTVAAYSVTSDKHSDFTFSAEEHGVIIGVVVARYHHLYQQGIHPMWTRKERFDYYFPIFSHIGNQPIKNEFIYCQGPDAVNPDTNVPYDDEVFGYNEAWSEYRYALDRVSGEMRSNITNSLDVWHLADDYDSLPHLGADWIQEDKSNIDRVLTVTSSVANQFRLDIYFRNWATRRMPLYSIPGLIDHF